MKTYPPILRLILTPLSIMSLWIFATSCDEVVNVSPPDAQGCEAIADACPEGTQCDTDALGNAFCAPLTDPPIANGGTTGGMSVEAGTQTAGDAVAGDAVSGEMSAGETTAGEVSAGETPAGEISAGETPAGDMVSGGEEAGTSSSMCGTFNTILKPTSASIPDVMLVVDRSYSMINTEDRWGPALRAISQVTQALEAEVSFGLTLFPDPTSNNVDQTEVNMCQSWGRDQFNCEEDVSACAPGRVLVQAAINNSFSVREALNNYPPVPNQATPTYSALQAAAQALLNQQSDSAEKVVILVTDGMPGCNFENNPTSCTCLTSAPFFCEFDNFAGMCLDDNRTVQEVTRLAGLGIKTIVVGMTIGLPSEGACIAGNECSYGGQGCVNGMCVNLAPNVLSAMAQAGGDPTGQYYDVDNLNEIEAQITRATASVAPCVFDISEIPEDLYDRLAVYLDGDLVPKDENRMDGWWAERGVLEFYGNTCDSIRDGMSHRIAARCE